MQAVEKGCQEEDEHAFGEVGIEEVGAGAQKEQGGGVKGGGVGSGVIAWREWPGAVDVMAAGEGGRRWGRRGMRATIENDAEAAGAVARPVSFCKRGGEDGVEGIPDDVDRVDHGEVEASSAREQVGGPGVDVALIDDFLVAAGRPSGEKGSGSERASLAWAIFSAEGWGESCWAASSWRADSRDS